MRMTGRAERLPIHVDDVYRYRASKLFASREETLIAIKIRFVLASSIVGGVLVATLGCIAVLGCPHLAQTTIAAARDAWVGPDR
jgi:hypothetical protein